MHGVENVVVDIVGGFSSFPDALQLLYYLFKDLPVLDFSEAFYVFEDECFWKCPLNVIDKGMDYFPRVSLSASRVPRVEKGWQGKPAM